MIVLLSLGYIQNINVGFSIKKKYRVYLFAVIYKIAVLAKHKLI